MHWCISFSFNHRFCVNKNTGKKIISCPFCKPHRARLCLAKLFSPAGILWQHWKYNKKSQKPVCTSHTSSVMQKVVHQFYCTSASPRRSVNDWWHQKQLTMTGDDKNVKTHRLDRKLAILEQLTERSWSDGTSWNVPDLSREDVWLSAGRRGYSPVDTWWMYTNLITVNSFSLLF